MVAHAHLVETRLIHGIFLYVKIFKKNDGEQVLCIEPRTPSLQTTPKPRQPVFLRFDHASLQFLLQRSQMLDLLDEYASGDTEQFLYLRELSDP